MQLSICGHQLELTTSIKNYVSEKMQRIERHFDHLNDTHVVLHVDKLRHEAEGTIHAKGITIHATADAENMYAAIDSLADKLDSQVRKHKEKRINHHQHGVALKTRHM